MTKDTKQGDLFTVEMQQQIRDRFYHVDEDPNHGTRLFFENAGGSLRLKAVVEAHNRLEAYPDCPERIHETALMLKRTQNAGIDDVRVLLNAWTGSILTSLTASQAMYEMIRTVAENVPGNNIVTTVLEHPSSYDAAKMYAEKTGKEFRVAQANSATGGVDVEDIVRLIDSDTCLLSVIYASNISGAILDIEKIVTETRKVKPDLHIIVDAVQHAPHGIIDVEKLKIDGINFAPYKCFGNRGVGFAYVSDRVAVLPHHKLLAREAGDWELGSPTPALFAAMSEIVSYVCWIGSQFCDSNDRRSLYVEGMTRIKLHERALLYRMLNGSEIVPGLRNISGIKVFLDSDDLATRDFILAMTIEGLDYSQAVKEYEREGVIVYERIAKSLYSQRMLAAFGMDGAIRVSPLHCHNINDIDRFLRITNKLSSKIR